MDTNLRVLMDSMRRSFLQEVRFIEDELAKPELPPGIGEYYDTVRRSRLQVVRGIEKQLNITKKRRRISKRNLKRPTRASTGQPSGSR